MNTLQASHYRESKNPAESQRGGTEIERGETAPVSCLCLALPPVSPPSRRLLFLRRAALLLGAMLVAGLLLNVSYLLLIARPRDELPTLPRLILWAWERPEDLRFLDYQHDIGVAALMGTLYLRGERVIAHPRLQPLQVTPGIKLMAVVRIESQVSPPPALTLAQQQQAVAAILRLAAPLPALAVQVDFDAKRSERTFYRHLLMDLRRQLPSSRQLSMTALASWCMYDDWLSALPVDEVVPMLFRMGPDGPAILSSLQTGKPFRSIMCQQSVGISTDESPPQLRRAPRVYVFHPQPWSEEAVRSSIAEVR